MLVPLPVRVGGQSVTFSASHPLPFIQLLTTMQAGQTPVFVMSRLPIYCNSEVVPDPAFSVDAAPERQTGRKAQISNIVAAKTVADVIRSCLGPKAMLKMLLDPMGGILYASSLLRHT